jgi:hypothetical protein
MYPVPLSPHAKGRNQMLDTWIERAGALQALRFSLARVHLELSNTKSELLGANADPFEEELQLA